MKTGTNTYSFMRPLVLFLLYIQALTSTLLLSGQCGPQIEWPDLDCSNAPLICLQNWCSVSPTFSQAGPNGFCGPNTVVNNPQYYLFIAEDVDVEIQILVGNCNGGSSDGLQCALLENCPWSNSDVIDCNPETHPGGIMTLQSYGFLEPGQLYWILIDGYAGGVCEYTFIQTTNIYEPELSDESTTIIASPPVVKPGYSGLHFEVSPAVDFAHGYYWILGWSGDTIITSMPSLDMNVPCDMMAGTYSVCVRAFSGCDTSDMDICTEVEFLPLEDVIKPSSIFCAAQFPFIWEDLVISGPGIYTQRFESPTWCFYDSIWQVDAYPESK